MQLVLITRFTDGGDFLVEVITLQQCIQGLCPQYLHVSSSIMSDSNTLVEAGPAHALYGVHGVVVTSASS